VGILLPVLYKGATSHKAYNKFHVMLQLRCTEKLADLIINKTSINICSYYKILQFF